jgi:hypothetical protein
VRVPAIGNDAGEQRANEVLFLGERQGIQATGDLPARRPDLGDRELTGEGGVTARGDRGLLVE